MASTAVSLCNRALSRIGAELITSLSGDSVNAQHCNTLYPGARREVLASHDWSFAIKRQSLTQLTATVDDWDYTYQLPSDCLKVVEMVDATDKTYQIEGQQLLCNESSVTLRYVYDKTHTAGDSPLFESALVLRLASLLSGPIKNARRLEQELLQEYLMVLTKARGEDATHAYGEDRPELWNER